MKKKDNILPTPDCLLYNEIHEYVEENSKEAKHEKEVIEQKIFYIIDALAIYIYGAPIFNSTYTAMKEGPVEQKIYEIQRKRKNVTKKPIGLNENEISFYKETANLLFQSVKEAFSKGLIKLDAATLSNMTHTPEWANKYYQFTQAKGRDYQFNVGKISKKDILKFAIDVLNKEYPQFVNFVKTSIDI